jgi:hypothetical protein
MLATTARAQLAMTREYFAAIEESPAEAA